MSTAAYTLLIDAGNSRIKWASLAQGRLTRTGMIDARLAAGEFRQAWDATGIVLNPPSRIVVADVGEADRITALCQAMPSALPVIRVRPQAKAYGVINAYADPERLGVDRWVGLVAAHQLVTGAACVVDCGTAITVDVVNSRGTHLGGNILPGLDTMKQGLMTHTAIPHSLYPDLRPIIASTGLLADTTQGAIQGGLIAAASGAIAQLLNEARTRLAEPVTAILTGGDAPVLLPYMPDARHEPDWILQGLQVIAEATP